MTFDFALLSKIIFEKFVKLLYVREHTTTKIQKFAKFYCTKNVKMIKKHTQESICGMRRMIEKALPSNN